MSDESTIPRVAEVMAHRLADRLHTVLDEDPRVLQERLAGMDGWTLKTLLKATAPASPPAGSSRHMGVLGVDHSLNRLVMADAGPHGPTRFPELDAVDLDALDDEDLIAAAHYVPETLPGYLLG